MSWSTRLILLQHVLLYTAIGLAWFLWSVYDELLQDGHLTPGSARGALTGLVLAVALGVVNYLSTKGVRDYRGLSASDQQAVDTALRDGTPHPEGPLRAAERTRSDALLPNIVGPTVGVLMFICFAAWFATSLTAAPLWYLALWLVAVLLVVAACFGVRRVVPAGVERVVRATRDEPR